MFALISIIQQKKFIQEFCEIIINEKFCSAIQRIGRKVLASLGQSGALYGVRPLRNGLPLPLGAERRYQVLVLLGEILSVVRK